MNIQLSQTKNKGNFFLHNQREILIGFCALLAMLVSLIFPSNLFGESFWSSFFLFLLFPFLAIIFILKEPLENFGVSWGKPRVGILWGSIAAAIFILIGFFLVTKPELMDQLSLARGIAGSFWYFLFFELAIALPLHFFWEFFFRGFIQFGLEKKLGAYSLFLQAMLQSVLTLRGSWLLSSLILSSSLAAGLIARQSRSIFYSFIFSWIISVSLDIILIRIIHQAII